MRTTIATSIATPIAAATVDAARRGSVAMAASAGRPTYGSAGDVEAPLAPGIRST